MIPLLAVIIVTNGRSPHLRTIAKEWAESSGFSLGKTLFFCGPKQELLACDILADGIIDYTDPPYYLDNFHINEKKMFACGAVAAEFLYLLHDRFIPQPGFKPALERALGTGAIDFGAVDVYNRDGTFALQELRLNAGTIGLSVIDALEQFGRLTREEASPGVSKHIGINGAQFFLHRSLVGLLRRPLRWVEMEDDILSHDLQGYRGYWAKDARLYTLHPRIAPNSDHSAWTHVKYAAYRSLCYILARIVRGRQRVVSAGGRLSNAQLQTILSGTTLLIDPLHKTCSSDFLPSSLEKMMARARIMSGGSCWKNIERCTLGWKLVGELDFDGAER